MKKNGFTLIELLAVIAILGILSVILIPNIMKIREETLNRNYESIKSTIETSAKDWAYDNLNELPLTLDSSSNYTICANITVGELISKGYLSGTSDNKTKILDPRNSESLNGNNVCIRYYVENGFDKRILIATLSE